jgi:hypothetical protein
MTFGASATHAYRHDVRFFCAMMNLVTLSA